MKLKIGMKHSNHRNRQQKNNHYHRHKFDVDFPLSPLSLRNLKGTQEPIYDKSDVKNQKKCKINVVERKTGSSD